MTDDDLQIDIRIESKSSADYRLIMGIDDSFIEIDVLCYDDDIQSILESLCYFENDRACVEYAMGLISFGFWRNKAYLTTQSFEEYLFLLNLSINCVDEFNDSDHFGTAEAILSYKKESVPKFFKNELAERVKQ